MNIIQVAVVNQIFLVAIAITILLVYYNKRKYPVKKKRRKLELYACGERIGGEEMQTYSEGFYWAFRKSFQSVYKYLLAFHSGIVSDYLTWLLFALVIFALFLMGGVLWA
jgi:hypothetical protein